MVFIGLDPGVGGGIAFIIPAPIVKCIKMPATQKDIWQWLVYAKKEGNDATFAIIEKVNTGFPGTSKSAMAKLYGSYKELTMVLSFLGIPFLEVTSSKWQTGLEIPSRTATENRTHWKNRLKAKAQQLFPGVNVTLHTADALLIAYYCRLRHEGKIK